MRRKRIFRSEFEYMVVWLHGKKKGKHSLCVSTYSTVIWKTLSGAHISTEARTLTRHRIDERSNAQPTHTLIHSLYVFPISLLLAYSCICHTDKDTLGEVTKVDY